MTTSTLNVRKIYRFSLWTHWYLVAIVKPIKYNFHFDSNANDAYLNKCITIRMCGKKLKYTTLSGRAITFHPICKRIFAMWMAPKLYRNETFKWMKLCFNGHFLLGKQRNHPSKWNDSSCSFVECVWCWEWVTSSQWQNWEHLNTIRLKRMMFFLLALATLSI